MLPWARAVAVAQRRSLPMIAPSWVQPRLGGFIRREREKRLYLRQFTNNGYIKGLRRALILSLAETVPESAAPEVATVKGITRPLVLQFSGLGTYFTDLLDHSTLIMRELLRIAHPAAVAQAETVRGAFIAMHVRRGDIMTHGDSEEELLQSPHYTPLSWYVELAKALNDSETWRALPIRIMSDGEDWQLAELLALPQCSRAPSASALGHLLQMSKATLLAASGHSTFSMWASYLGRMPTLYYPGRMDQNVFPAGSGLYEGEWRPATDLPSV